MAEDLCAQLNANCERYRSQQDEYKDIESQNFKSEIPLKIKTRAATVEFLKFVCKLYLFLSSATIADKWICWSSHNLVKQSSLTISCIHFLLIHYAISFSLLPSSAWLCMRISQSSRSTLLLFRSANQKSYQQTTNTNKKAGLYIREIVGYSWAHQIKNDEKMEKFGSSPILYVFRHGFSSISGSCLNFLDEIIANQGRLGFLGKV